LRNHQRERGADGVRGREVVPDEQQRDQEEATARADQRPERTDNEPQENERGARRIVTSGGIARG